jgi:hypothetical protein
MLMLLIFLWLVPVVVGAQSAAREDLPHEAQVMLDAKYPGWNFWPVAEEIRAYFKKEQPSARLNLVTGDFDGDGRTDYAALVEHGIITDNNGVPIGRDQHLVAFLQRKAGFKLYALTECGGGDYIFLAKKGEGGYSYEQQREIVYEHDAICTAIWEKGGSSYVFEKDHFRCFVSSD